jgi:cobalamin biosynthesis protein CobD/CbiB
MKKESRQLFVPIVILFIVLNALFVAGKSWLVKYGMSQDVLIIGNLILFAVTIASLYFHVKGFLHKNIQVFFRSVYGALMIKMFVCAAAVIVYALAAKPNINKPALYICMALYFVYSFMEVRMVFRLLKQKQENKNNE